MTIVDPGMEDDAACRCGHPRSEHWGAVDNAGVIEGCYGNSDSDEGDGRCKCPGYEEDDQ